MYHATARQTESADAFLPVLDSGGKSFKVRFPQESHPPAPLRRQIYQSGPLFRRKILCKMNERLEQIRKLLSELEVEMKAGAAAGDRDFSALELPLIIQEIVDDLQPQLSPYDAAFYWFLFRHSIANNGDPHLRVSTRHLRTAVVKSSYSQADESPVSLGKVQDTLRALEGIGAIRKEGEPNRDGTLYRVLIPEEIEACRRFRAERVAAEREAAEPQFKFPHSGIEID